MYKDDLFTANDITAANISKISKKQSEIEEQRICEISELAEEAADFAMRMIEEGYGIYEVLSFIAEGIFGLDTTVHSHSMPENSDRLISYLKITTAYDRIVFSELFAEKIRSRGIILSETEFLPSFSGDESFTYVKNPLADEAYDVFSQEFSNPRLRYSKNFSDAAKSVADGEFEYALLPLEERGGARLSAVAALLFRDDLKINSVTPVFGFEGLADMKYALVSKHFTVPEFREDDDRYLEIRMRADSSIPLSEIFAAADSLGCTLYRINTISFDTEDGAVQYYSVVFRDMGKDFTLLLVFLTVFSGAYIPVGIYKNLE